ncbi:Alpha-ketoglutarate-dependent sulfonate dioxygenase [Cyphellophora attinorum]|uniref:Alpha-ketoglutarate-dependent sulfonate dioxygenase n=1 Tax=Cyphellophora attinorum TaxID=1664694 RepID=A0A0N1HK81_9EURO|nr:Alpha-ketoglutarate-dependent sulfonate dioxygenase [Phialophora attinorum]KPI34574.1 Alpha-ketoglutarate-dependent sulfonate dioxygenase [Phialophora attinorum]
MATTTETVASKQVKLTAAYDEEAHKAYKYSAYLPVYDEETKFPPLEPFEFKDKALLADPKKPNLLSDDNGRVKVTDAQKNKLALLLAERGVVVFRDQDFKDIGTAKQKAFGQYFGPLHIHPVGAHVKDNLELHNIYLGSDNLYRAQQRSAKLTSIGYHSDVSYEHQTPGITLLTLLTVPSTGGDTAWVNQTLAYERLSEPIKKLLEGLKAEHSGFPQAENARRDSKFVRREPVSSEHPIVRVHPATGRKALFFNPGFTKRIIGLKVEESDAILKLLFKHISLSADLQVRVKWDDRTVTLWDNRVTAHTAINDYNVQSDEDGLRHGFRITTLAEKPVGVNGLESTW